jgi:hypothetical protein
MRAGLAMALLGMAVLACPAQAKTFKYASGPKPGTDTTFAVSESQITPIVRRRGPKVPATNFEVLTLVANSAYANALRAAPIDSGSHVVLAPAESHPLNLLVEHALLRELSRRGVTVTVRRSILSDDSLAVYSPNGDPLLEYQLASARVSYLRLVGWLPFSGRVKIERQSLVEGALSIRDPRSANVLWTNGASYNLVDAFPRDRLALVEDERYSELKSAPPTRNVDKVFEPIIVVAVVGGLVALFFQNRP